MAAAGANIRGENLTFKVKVTVATAREPRRRPPTAGALLSSGDSPYTVVRLIPWTTISCGGGVVSCGVPICGSEDSKVVDSRDSEAGDAIRRRRECVDCERRYTTYERIDEMPLMVVKRDGHEEVFSRANC